MWILRIFFHIYEYEKNKKMKPLMIYKAINIWTFLFLYFIHKTTILKIIFKQ